MRPVLIVQSQTLLDAMHPSTLVLPLTTRLIDDADPLRLRLPAQDRLEQDSDILVDQLQAIDNRRLITGPLARCGKELTHKIFAALREVMDIPNDPGK